MGIFSNGPEYELRLRRLFRPPAVTIQQIHAEVPKHLLQRSSLHATLYVLRDVLLAISFVGIATQIDSISLLVQSLTMNSSLLGAGVRWTLWTVYWFFQGLVGAGIFCLGHDAGHGSLFDSHIANNVIGFIFHSILLIPYFSWRTTHHAHHKATGSIERDENYVPYQRKDFKLLPRETARRADYAEVFEETPIWTLVRVVTMSARLVDVSRVFVTCMHFSFRSSHSLYRQNAMGAKMYPKGTNHFSPNSPLFKPHQRPSIILSDLGLGCVVAALCVVARYAGWAAVGRYYFVPYILTNHWIVMFTYLHHSDPTIPHYYGSEWTFLRGAAATVDRPLLGWMGRFFLHNISHDHIAHHFFVGVPFYNGPEITKHIKTVLGDDYNYDSTNTFYAFWRSFTQCLFIEESEDGGIAFYKNAEGKAAREVAEGVLGMGIQKNGE